MKILLLFLPILFYSNFLYSNENQPFSRGKLLYEQKNFSQAKLEFEKSIVLEPKKTNSYIYLSKIYSESKNTKEEKKNLQTAVLLEPRNEEALYLLTQVNITQGDFKSLGVNYITLSKNCSKLCDKLILIKNSIDKFKK